MAEKIQNSFYEKDDELSLDIIWIKTFTRSERTQNRGYVWLGFSKFLSLHPPGLEPGISSSGERRRIHWATSAAYGKGFPITLYIVLPHHRNNSWLERSSLSVSKTESFDT